MGPKFKPFVGILTALLLAATLLSQSAMDLFSILLSLMLLAAYARTRKTDQKFELFPRMGLEFVWIAWFIVVAMGFALNWSPGSNWFIRLVEFKWIFFLYILLSTFSLLRWEAQLTARVVAIIMLLCSGLGLLLFRVHHQERLEGLLNPMTYAHMYGPMLCLLIAFFICGYRSFLHFPSSKALVAAAIVVTGVSVLLTFTRGVWVGCAVGIIAMGFALNWIWGLSIMAFGATAAMTMYILWPSFHTRVLQVFGVGYSYDDERFVLWKTNLFIFRQHPIFGLGYGENSRRLREFYDILGVPAGQFESHAHNQYIHLLAGTGILGAGIYVGLAIFFLVLSFKLYRKRPDPFEKAIALGCFGGLLCFYVAGGTESNFEHAKVRMIIMFLWAAVLHLKTREQFTDSR